MEEQPSGNEILLLNEYNKERLLNSLILGFYISCKQIMNKDDCKYKFSFSGPVLYFSDVGGYFGDTYIDQSKFKIYKEREDDDFKIDATPFCSETRVKDSLARPAKILILIFFLALIKNFIENKFDSLDCKITNTTNKANLGLFVKTFGSKLKSNKLSEDLYSFEILVKDFVETESRIRKLLKIFLFGQTIFMGKICHLTDLELVLIKQTCNFDFVDSMI